MKKKKTLGQFPIRIQHILILVSGFMMLGFINIFFELFKSNVVNILTLFMVPSLMGGLIINSNEYRGIGEYFILSSGMLLIGFLLMKSMATVGNNLIQFIWFFGLFIFARGLFYFNLHLLIFVYILWKRRREI